MVSTLKDGFGFVRCAERDEDLFFPLSGLPSDLDAAEIRVGLELVRKISTDRFVLLLFIWLKSSVGLELMRFRSTDRFCVVDNAHWS